MITGTKTSFSATTKRIRRFAPRSPFNIARPRVVFVVAYDKQFVIGKDGGLPWHLPDDLLHFKALTIGKPVIMGRKTFASMRRPLKLRRNIVLTRDTSFYAEGIEVARGADEVLELTRDSGEIAVIGGAEIFALFSPYVDSIYATEIDAEVGGDAQFSFPQRDCVRIETGEHPADERNPYPFRYVRYDFTARTAT